MKRLIVSVFTLLVVMFLLPPLLVGQTEEVSLNTIKILPSGFNKGKVERNHFVKRTLDKIPSIQPGEQKREVIVLPATVTKAGVSKSSLRKLYIFKY